MKDEFIAGAFAGFVARLLTAPFDVLKIRYQVQSNTDMKYKSLFQSIRTIINEEGFFALWKGYYCYSLINLFIYSFIHLFIHYHYHYYYYYNDYKVIHQQHTYG